VRQPLELEELVAEVREGLQSETAGRVLEWRVGALPTVVGDRVLLRQVVANLLGNAVKFTRRWPDAMIEIGATSLRAGDAEVTFFVRDNGAGFNPKYLDKLFGVFQRLHNARDFEGTGIGLANVKRIINRHGGRVWAEGAVEQGAVFDFTLARSEGSPMISRGLTHRWRRATNWAVCWACVLGLSLSAGGGEPARVIVFGTVERFTPRGAPVRGLDDAAFDQDLAETVAKAVGLPFRFVEKKTFPEVMAAFERGEIDVIPSLGRVPERQARMLFSVRHTVSALAVFVREGTRPPTALAEVESMRLVVVGRFRRHVLT